MPGLLSYVAAGAMSGLGSGLAEEARAAREAALRKLEMDRQDRIRAEDRANTVADRTDQRAYEVGVRQEGYARQDRIRGEDRANAVADRTDQRTYEGGLPGTEFQSMDGTTYQQPKAGGPAKVVVDEQGNPIRTYPKASSNALSAAQQRVALDSIGSKIGLTATEDDVRLGIEQALSAGVDPAKIRPFAEGWYRQIGITDPAELQKRLSAFEEPGNTAAAPAKAAPGKKPPLGMMPPMPGQGGIPTDLKKGERVRGDDGTVWSWTGNTWEPAS